MKQTKNIVMLSITIVVLIGIVAAATYSYFTAAVNTNNKITTNVTMPSRPTFVVEGAGTLALTVTRANVLQSAVNNTVSVNKTLTIKLTGENATTCTYNVKYTHGATAYTKANSSGFDIGYTLDAGTETDYSTIGVASKTTTLATGKTLTIASGKAAQATVKLTLTFHNRNWDQSAIAGKTYTGTFFIDNVTCS